MSVEHAKIDLIKLSHIIIVCLRSRSKPPWLIVWKSLMERNKLMVILVRIVRKRSRVSPRGLSFTLCLKLWYWIYRGLSLIPGKAIKSRCTLSSPFPTSSILLTMSRTKKPKRHSTYSRELSSTLGPHKEDTIIHSSGTTTIPSGWNSTIRTLLTSMRSRYRGRATEGSRIRIMMWKIQWPTQQMPTSCFTRRSMPRKKASFHARICYLLRFRLTTSSWSDKFKFIKNASSMQSKNYTWSTNLRR